LLAVIAARPVATTGPFVRDFEAYWSAGRVANHGADPYGRAIWQAERSVPGVDASRDELLPFVGPPYTLWLWRAFGAFEFTAAARVWWMLLALCTAALAIVALIGSGLTPRWPPMIGATLFAFSFGPIASGLSLGQATAVAMLGACLAALSARSTRTGSIVPATIAALLQPNIALGEVALFTRIRCAIALAIAAAIAYLAGVAASGWAWPWQYLQLLGAHAAAERFSTIQFVPPAIFYGAGIGPHVAVVGGYAVTIAAIVAGVIAFARIGDAYARFACLSALVPFAAGFVHEHDLIVAFPAAMLTAARSRGTTRVVAAVATLLVAIDWLGFAERPSVIAQSAMLAIAAGCMFAAFGPASKAELVAAPVVGAIFACAAWLAIRHPVAVWPDALGAFHVPVASAASTWHAELERNGLLSVNPAAALLRALSLIGCALLAAAVWRQRTSLNVDVHDVVERRPRVGLESG
jgi:hypothetical protein